MQPLTAQEVRENAFRVLGIPATATQLDIDRAARQMRLWSNPDRIPPTQWDMNWLGKLCRSRSNIEQAVAALGEPASRVRQRLLWFHSAATHSAHATGDSLEQLAQTLLSANEPAAVHDAALARLCAASMFAADAWDHERWQRVIDGFRSLSQSRDYQMYVLSLEQNGDFEKRACETEVVQALDEMAAGITAGLAATAGSALEEGELQRAIGIVRLLGALDREDAVRLLDRAEDLLERRCTALEDQLRREIKFHDVNQRTNHNVCREVSESYKNSIESILKEIEALGPAEAHRAQRLCWQAARLLSMLGTAWIAAGHFVTAQNTFDTALRHATGTPLERFIQGQIDENAPRVAIRHSARFMHTDDSGITRGGRRIVPAPPPLVHPLQPPRSPPPLPTRRRNTARPAAVITSICILLATSLARFIATSSGPQTTDTPSYQLPSQLQVNRYIEEPRQRRPLLAPDVIAIQPSQPTARPPVPGQPPSVNVHQEPGINTTIPRGDDFSLAPSSPAPSQQGPPPRPGGAVPSGARGGR